MKTKDQAINVKGIDGEVWHSLNGKYIEDHDTAYLVAFVDAASLRACKRDIAICNAMAKCSERGIRWHNDMAKSMWDEQDRDWQICACVCKELARRGWITSLYERWIMRFK